MTAETGPDLRPDAATMPDVPVFELPVVRATSETLSGYGRLVDEPDACAIEIVRWPAAGWRPVDPGTGDEAGTVRGTFACSWEDGTLYAVNDAVGGDYVLGWSVPPRDLPSPGVARERVLLWHANYHPDGGQQFFPLDPGPFVVPLALAGDDVRPADFVAFWFDGSQGLYIHPGIWHEGVFPVGDRQRFFDEQGRVHARVSVDFTREFDCYVAAPLPDAPPGD